MKDQKLESSSTSAEAPPPVMGDADFRPCLTKVELETLQRKLPLYIDGLCDADSQIPLPTVPRPFYEPVEVLTIVFAELSWRTQEGKDYLG